MALYDGTNAPTVTVEIDVSKVGSFVIGASLIGGTDTLASGSIVWGALTTTDIRALSIRRGRTREDQAVQPGSLSLTLDNRSGKYDPDNPASPYYVGAFSILNRGLGVRVSATWSGTTYLIYRGYLEQIDIDQSLDPIATIQFTDALAYIATQTVPAVASSYSGDTTATRLGRILDSIGWDATLRNITGTRQMQPTTFGDTALSLGDQVSRCEFGRFYADRQGKITLLPYESTFSTPTRLAFSDTRAAGTVEYDTIVTAPGAKYLVNQVTLQQTTSTSQTYLDTTSQAIYGTYSKTYDAPLLDNAVTLALATLITNRYSLPKTRVDRVEFDAIGIDSTSWVQLLQSDLGDNMTVTRTTVDGRTRTFTSLVESINFDLTPYKWRVGMDLAPASGVAYFTIGTSLIGGFDILTN